MTEEERNILTEVLDKLIAISNRSEIVQTMLEELNKELSSFVTALEKGEPVDQKKASLALAKLNIITQLHESHKKTQDNWLDYLVEELVLNSKR